MVLFHMVSDERLFQGIAVGLDGVGQDFGAAGAKGTGAGDPAESIGDLKIGVHENSKQVHGAFHDQFWVCMFCRTVISRCQRIGDPPVDIPSITEYIPEKVNPLRLKSEMGQRRGHRARPRGAHRQTFCNWLWG